MRFIIVLTLLPKTVAAASQNRHAGARRAGARLDVQRSFVVGDRHGDVEMARNARARSILVRTGYGEGELAWHAAKWRVQPDLSRKTLRKRQTGF